MARPVKNYCDYKGPCGNSKWRRPDQVTIYLMNLEGSNTYKIGYTSNTPEQRMSVIRFYFPNIKLIDHVLCDFSIEKHLYEMFRLKKVDNGYREFFALSNEDVSYVLELFKSLRNG